MKKLILVLMMLMIAPINVQAANESIFFIGDSITKADGIQTNYSKGHPILGYQEVFRQKGILVGSYGVSGASYRTSDFAKKEAPSLYNDLLFGQRRDFMNYQRIVFLAGTNDVAYEYKLVGDKNEKTTLGALRLMIEYVQKVNPQAQIYICSPNYSTSPHRQPERMNILTEGMQQLARKTGNHFIDVFHEGPVQSDNSLELLFDGVHPNNNGHKLLGEYLYQEIYQ